MSEPLKFKANLRGDGSLEFFEGNTVATEIPEEQAESVRDLGATVKAYVDATDGFVKTKYAHIKDWIPIHLSDPGEVMALLCIDGVVIRFNSKGENAGVIGAWIPQSLTEVVPIISQQVVHCDPDRNYTSIIPTTGMTLTIRKTTAETGSTEDVATIKMGLDVVLERPAQMPLLPSKPFVSSRLGVILSFTCKVCRNKLRIHSHRSDSSS
jgi:hypothetical protein